MKCLNNQGRNTLHQQIPFVVKVFEAQFKQKIPKHSKSVYLVDFVSRADALLHSILLYAHRPYIISLHTLATVSRRA